MPAALTTLLIIVLIVILPAAMLTNILAQEAIEVYQRVKSRRFRYRRLPAANDGRFARMDEERCRTFRP